MAEVSTPPDSTPSQTSGVSIWERRPGERDYALLNDPESKEANRYGQKIDLLDLTGLPAERSLNINQNPDVGCNPNRNKQHGFYFNADNCIGCHACEAACAEKNETPAHLAFRSVGYVEGGSFPDYQRVNISMACNHCDDPVCLKGCPTAAYTKHAEYGAVLQDPDTCFGCGYCTWVCPYNAPQLDPVQGQVSKCNMCVDRLEVGLKPACVSACVGNALDFGVIENIPEGREQAKTSIPGFPDPEITHPNIRFQQKRTLPDEMRRTDSNPIKYRQGANSEYSVSVDRKHGVKRAWNLGDLSSRENVLVGFTLSSQIGIGLFSLLALSNLVTGSTPGFAYFGLSIVAIAAVGVALFLSTAHLGKPVRFYRGFNNLKYSPVSREGLGIALFMMFACIHVASAALVAPDIQPWLPEWLTAGTLGQLLASTLPSVSQLCVVLAIVSGMVGLYYMVKCYRIPARPFWNHWQVGTSFFGTALSFGSAILLTASALGIESLPALWLAGLVACGLGAEGIGLYFHAKDMAAADHEGSAAHYTQQTQFGYTYILRNIVLFALVATAAGIAIIPGLEHSLVASLLLLGGMTTTSIIGRALFYVLVIPTTMPGAFFWRNPSFEEHARETGLAALPQVGIVEHTH